MQTEEIVAQLYVGLLFNSCTVLRIAGSVKWAHGLNGEPSEAKQDHGRGTKDFLFIPGLALCSAL